MSSRVRTTAVSVGLLVMIAATGGLAYRFGESAGQREARSTTSTSLQTPTSVEQRRPVLGEATGISLAFMARELEPDQYAGVLTVDIDGGTTRETAIVGGPLRVRDRPARRDQSVVVVHNKSASLSDQDADSEAWAYPPTFDSPPRVLGSASSVLASVAPDRVWLLSADRTPTSSSSGLKGGTVREVDLGGQVVVAPQTYPPERRPVAAVEGGLLRQVQTPGVYGDTFDLWDPGRDAVVRRVANEPAFFVDARGKSASWLADSGLHLTDVTTGLDRIVQRPSNRLAFTSRGRFSPDGRYLAAQMVDASSVGGPQPALTRFATDEIFPETWGLVDIATGRTTVIEGSRNANGGAPAGFTWSADSKWFFFAGYVTDPGDFGPGFGADSIIMAYRAGSSKARAVHSVLPQESGVMIPAA